MANQKLLSWFLNVGKEQSSYHSLSVFDLYPLNTHTPLSYSMNNGAYNGAGIHLVDSSSIILNTGSILLFKHNTASGQGGSIYTYADTCSLIQTEFCVFKFINPSPYSDA